MKLIGAAAAAAVAEALTAPELDALDEAELPAAGGDFIEPDRAVAAAAGCCWLRGKMKAGAC